MTGQITIDINGYCNNECEMCYQDLDGSELSLDEIVSFVKGNLSSDVVEIGGGEPFLHKDLLEIIAQIVDGGKRVHISTNATFIPKGLLDLREEVRNSTTIQVSLFGGTREVYQKVTKKDFFDRVVKNASRLKKRYKTVISSPIYQENFDTVPKILGIAYGLGIPIRINLTFPEGKGKDVELLKNEQINRLRSYLLIEKIKHGGMVDSPLLHENNCTALERAYGIEKKGVCPADCGKSYITPRREAYACEFLRNG